jgi:hypothetical protein
MTDYDILRNIILDAKAETGLSMDKLTVLNNSNDPYRLNTKTGHINGSWLAQQLETVAPGAVTVHLRGIHYRLVAFGGIIKPNGELYHNTNEDWVWLQNNAANCARWLGYVPFDRIIDERNAPPLFKTRLSVPLPASHSMVTPSINDDLFLGLLNKFDTKLSEPWFFTRFFRHQPYRIILIGEKTSLADVLEPLSERYNTDILLGTGESSTTNIYKIAQAAAEDYRPTIVLYFSDFDPSGWQMPISVSHKLQAFKDLYFPARIAQR